MSDKNLFEIAAYNQYRFPSFAGGLTVEDLFSLPLKTRNNLDLDTVARGICRKLAQEDEESFVEESKSTEVPHLRNKLDIVKHIITVKQSEAKTMREAQDRAMQKQQLLEILHDKKTESLQSLSIEEIEAKINAL